MWKLIKGACDAARERDPAARSRVEVLMCYPSVWAIGFHGISGWMWKRGWYFLGRWISQWGRFLTGIEIHPGAHVGRGVFIDHGMGVVIGETAVVGDNVTLYQGVTLGGVMPAVESGLQRCVKRHPTLEEGVIVGSGAQILGDIVIGSYAKVGANSVVTKPVASRAVMVGNPAQEVKRKAKSAVQDSQDEEDISREKFASYGFVNGEAFHPLLERIEVLEKEVSALKKGWTRKKDKGDTGGDVGE